MNRIAAAAAAVSAVLLAAPATSKDNYVFGPEPDWAGYKALGTPAVLAALPDPSGWSVQWPNGYGKGRWPNKGRPDGYVTCGYVERGDVSGDYARINFAVVIDYGHVLAVDVGMGGSKRLVNGICRVLVDSGKLPPASMMEARGSADITRLGLDLRVTPDGAYISAVSSGSAAASAGLRPGMVIASVNGIALASLGDGMIRVIDAARGEVALGLIGAPAVKLHVEDVR